MRLLLMILCDFLAKSTVFCEQKVIRTVWSMGVVLIRGRDIGRASSISLMFRLRVASDSYASFMGL